MAKRRRPNLLVIGASGGVARAFLRRLPGLRSHFGRLVLLDKNRRVLEDAHLEHDRLDYVFVRRRLDLPRDGRYFHRLLRQHRIEIVLDVSTHPTLPMLDAVEAAGVRYVNTSLNDEELEVTDLVARLEQRNGARTSAPRILCAGMNPGIVNLWVRHGIARYGVPEEIIHFEYDTSMTMDQWRPLVTWSKHEFLMETTWNRTGVYDGEKVALRESNALENVTPLRPLLKPILGGDHYPPGLLVLHEENITLGSAVRTPSKFVYALHPRTMRHLQERYRKQGTLRISDVELGDNLGRRLNGTDLVGVCLQYPRRRVYYVNRMDNRQLIGTNATCTQVAIGIYSALFTLLYDKLKRRIYFTGDLHETRYRQFVFANLRVEMFICARRGRRWVLRKHIPEVRLRRLRDTRPVVI